MRTFLEYAAFGVLVALLLVGAYLVGPGTG